MINHTNEEYRLLDGQKELPDLFLRKGTEVFHEIVSDFRMIVLIENKQTLRCTWSLIALVTVACIIAK